MKKYYLYILADKKNGSLHIDITDDLIRNIDEFQMCETEFFKKKNKHFLVYYEKAGNIINAIKLKKKLEKWDRFWKETLIENCNPLWEDLYPELDSNFYHRATEAQRNNLKLKELES